MDSADTDMRCDYICVKPSAPVFCQHCRQAVLWSDTNAKRCAEHAYLKAVTCTLPPLSRLEEGGLDESLYVGEDDRVYDVENTAVGSYVEGKVRVFEIL
jgi:hypothetical protein